MEENDEIKRLINEALDDTNWRGRVAAVKKLRKFHTEETEHVIVKLALHDPVYDVKNMACIVAKEWNVQVGGKLIRFSKPKEKNTVVNLNNKLRKTRELLGEDYTLDEFKSKFKELYPRDYDVLDGVKRKKLDKFFGECIESFCDSEIDEY